MKQLIERWKAKMPLFWKKVLILFSAIGGAALAVKMGNESFGLNLPVLILTVCNYTIAVCCAVGLSAKLTKV